MSLLWKLFKELYRTELIEQRQKRMFQLKQQQLTKFRQTQQANSRPYAQTLPATKPQSSIKADYERAHGNKWRQVYP